MLTRLPGAHARVDRLLCLQVSYAHVYDGTLIGLDQVSARVGGRPCAVTVCCDRVL